MKIPNIESKWDKIFLQIIWINSAAFATSVIFTGILFLFTSNSEATANYDILGAIVLLFALVQLAGVVIAMAKIIYQHFRGESDV